MTPSPRNISKSSLRNKFCIQKILDIIAKNDNVGLAMKKTTTKLQLTKCTIRILQTSELANVVGGAPTIDCTNVAATCRVVAPVLVDRK
jgi:hypothetical protein